MPPAVAVIVAVAEPEARTAVTVPSEETEATDASEEVQVTFLSLALSGFTVAVSLEVLPSVRFKVLSERPAPEISTDSTGMEPLTLKNAETAYSLAVPEVILPPETVIEPPLI